MAVKRSKKDTIKFDAFAQFFLAVTNDFLFHHLLFRSQVGELMGEKHASLTSFLVLCLTPFAHFALFTL